MKLGALGREARRKQLVDVTIKIFAKKGYSAASVNAPGVHRIQSVISLNPWPLKIIGTHLSARAARVFTCFAPET